MVKIKRTGIFNQSLDKLCTEDSDLAFLINQKIKWFQNNPQNTRLDNHTLTKKLSGQYAFSISDDIRIKYEWTNKTTVRFLDIGSHSKVYPVPELPKKQSPKR